MKYNLFPALLLTVMTTASAPVALATTWYVNGLSGSDTNNCTSPTTACKTIGHTVSVASSGDSIRVAAATYTENLKITKSLRILGAGAATTIIDGGAIGTVVTISTASVHVTLSRVTIRNGKAHSGGGISNQGTLSVVNSLVTGNAAAVSCDAGCFTAGAGILNNSGASLNVMNSAVTDNNSKTLCSAPSSCTSWGAGIANFGGTLVIKASTLSGNNATANFVFEHPNSFAYGGGVYSDNMMLIINSTIAGNAAVVPYGGPPVAGSGGGIFNSGTMVISNTTISDNTAFLRSGGGISNRGTANFQNAVVSNNSEENCSGAMTSNGYNLSSDGSCPFTNTGDMNNTDPKLGPLQNNGGPTQTMALPSRSPAINAGNPSGCTDGNGHLLTTDQRGQPRPDKEDTSGCDMGAYESQSD